MRAYLDIVKLVWPLALGMVNNAVMQFVDRAYLAHWSLQALEAVLPAGILMWIFAGFFQSVVGYSSVFVAQYHGAGEPHRCFSVYRVAMALSVLAGALSLPICPLGNWMLVLSAPSEAVYALERDYFTVTMLGSFFIYGQMAAASLFTGRGRTRIVFWVNLLGNLLNIALDPLFIFTFGLGIAGAAYATVLSMAVQFVVLTVVANREAGWKPWPLEFGLAGRILRFGVPSGVYTILNMLSFTIFVFVTGGVGELELAVSNACFTLNYLIAAPREGFALGASTLVAQAIGRGDRPAADLAARRTTLLGVLFVVAMAAFVLAFRRPVLSLFAAQVPSESLAAFHSLALTLLALMSLWLVFDATDIILSGALKGAGDTGFVMIWMLFCGFALWMPAVFAVRAWHNTMPILWSTLVIYVIILCIGSCWRWKHGAWRSIDIVGREQEK